jgi:hypothetical protein
MQPTHSIERIQRHEMQGRHVVLRQVKRPAAVSLQDICKSLMRVRQKVEAKELKTKTAKSRLHCVHYLYGRAQTFEIFNEVKYIMATAWKVSMHEQSSSI